MQNSKEDWERESAQMGKVYSNGLLHIAATSSTDGEGGLFPERPSKLPRESTACYISSSWTDHSNSNLLIHPSYFPSGMLLDGPLLSRGWVPGANNGKENTSLRETPVVLGVQRARLL
jgi:hypothetical protein